jgi:hypothetical protein
VGGILRIFTLVLRNFGQNTGNRRDRGTSLWSASRPFQKNFLRFSPLGIEVGSKFLC